MFNLFKRKKDLCIVTTPLNTYKYVECDSIWFDAEVMNFELDNALVSVEKDTALITIGFLTIRANDYV